MPYRSSRRPSSVPPLPPFVRQARRRVAKELSEIEGTAWEALAGQPKATARYSKAYRDLVSKLANTPLEEVTALGHADTALFGIEAQRGGASLGALLAVLKGQLSDQARLETLQALLKKPDHSWGKKLARVRPEQRARFMRRVAIQSLSRATPQPLQDISELLALSSTELAAVFGVSRQAVDQWLDDGRAPTARQPSIYAVHKTAKLLEANLKSERVPAIVRRPSEWFGGRSILEAFGDGEYDPVLERVRASFDWGRVA